MKHGVEGEGGKWVTYRNEEITKLFTKNGFTEEEARKLLQEHEESHTHYFKNGGHILLQNSEDPQDTLIPIHDDGRM